MATAGKKIAKKNNADLVNAQAASSAKVHAKDAPNPVWFKPVMFGLMLLGLVWIVTFYITSATLQLPVPALGQGNIFVGFGFVLAGFLMTPWWK